MGRRRSAEPHGVGDFCSDWSVGCGVVPSAPTRGVANRPRGLRSGPQYYWVQFAASANPRYAFASHSASSGVAPKKVKPVTVPEAGGGTSSPTSMAAQRSACACT
jgi:hypothetical protein